MRTASFGTTGRAVPVIGQGAWYIESADRKTALAALRAGLDHGMTHIDTAEAYGSGRSEEVVAEAISGRRDEVFLVSKVLPKNASRKRMRDACEASLRRLRVAHLDCYLLHWRGDDYPLEDTFAGFDDLLRAGKILSWGVSNFDDEDLDELAAIAGDQQPACNQVLYHLGRREIESAVIPWCVQHGVAVVGYSPFAHGSFPSAHSAGGRALAAIGAAHGATARQIALAFLTRQPGVFTIPKAANPQHAIENAGAGDLTLSAPELAQLDAVFPPPKNARPLPSL